MARRTKEEAKATRERLLDAAETLFLAQGVTRTSLAEVATAAGHDARRGLLALQGQGRPLSRHVRPGDLAAGSQFRAGRHPAPSRIRWERCARCPSAPCRAWAPTRGSRRSSRSSSTRASSSTSLPALPPRIGRNVAPASRRSRTLCGDAADAGQLPADLDAVARDARPACLDGRHHARVGARSFARTTSPRPPRRSSTCSSPVCRRIHRACASERQRERSANPRIPAGREDR